MSKEIPYENPFLKEGFTTTDFALGIGKRIDIGRTTHEVTGDEGLETFPPELVGHYRGVIKAAIDSEGKKAAGLRGTLLKMIGADDFDIYLLDPTGLERLAESDPSNMFESCVQAMQKSQKQEISDRFMSFVLSTLFLTGEVEYEADLIRVLEKKPGFKESCVQLLKRSDQRRWFVNCRDAIAGRQNPKNKDQKSYQFENLMRFCGLVGYARPRRRRQWDSGLS